MKFFKMLIYYIGLPFKYLFIGLIYLYKYTISLILPKTCRFTPSCSTYGIKAIREYGILKGGLKTSWRILRCNPFNKNVGFDPVKENIKGDIKWVL